MTPRGSASRRPSPSSKRPLQVKALQAFAPDAATGAPAPKANTTRAEYEAMVLAGKEYIKAGDIFQFVPSQRFETDYTGSPLDLYRALRHVNPSPYMFCLRFPDGFSLVGSSPEVHVKCLDGKIEIRPIAGTRWRGKTPAEDDALAARTARRSQGTRRAHHARRSRAQRRRPRLRIRQREGERLHDHRALLATSCTSSPTSRATSRRDATPTT